MKALLTTLLLLLVPVSFSYGGDNAFFFGGRYDDGFMLSFGTAIDVGPNLWLFEYANWGDPYGDVSSEVTYIHNVFGGLSVGVLLGPNVDVFDDVDDDAPPVTYITGATGLVATYEFGVGETFNNVGLWGYGKYKASLQKDDQYLDGWAVGGGLYVWW